MVSTLPNPSDLEVRTPDGRVYAYLVSADELARLRGEVEELRRQVTALTAEAAEANRRLSAAGLAPLPPMPDDEVRQLMSGPHRTLGSVIAELGSGDGDGSR